MVPIHDHPSTQFRHFNHFSATHRPPTATVISQTNLCRLV
ncbi:hypothetical protein HMPREF9577_00424 [Cutibacterium acnes HL110PA3]|nr:hypothetical protein HMPREF9618_00773 [Cutibacterium acnes HL082PA1]EFT26951.1 hypothetical protein HMPREF9577_00424 [Cutibacterium acnes HL110PA3]